MNLLLPFTINTLWSFKRELFFVSLTFLMVLLLPFVAVIALSQSGIQEISDQLAEYDSVNKAVQLYYPDGKPYKLFSANVTLPVKGVFTNEFGKALPPFYLFHTGTDIANPSGRKGDPVTPMMKGTVTYAGEIFWGFGKHVIIDHGDNVTSLYGHLDTIKVKEGDEVKPGNVIGTEGSTGWSTGPHLHFQIMVFGIPVNPSIFL